MTLSEYIKQNGDKTVEVQEDGTIKVVGPKRKWVPEYGDYYWYLSEIGFAREDMWENMIVDGARGLIGNVFKSREDAERMMSRLKARKKLLGAGGHEGFAELTGVKKYAAYRGFLRKELICLECKSVDAFTIWFESREDCQKAIDSLTHDEAKALCWDVEEDE